MYNTKKILSLLLVGLLMLGLLAGCTDKTDTNDVSPTPENTNKPVETTPTISDTPVVVEPDDTGELFNAFLDSSIYTIERRLRGVTIELPKKLKSNGYAVWEYDSIATNMKANNSTDAEISALLSQLAVVITYKGYYEMRADSLLIRGMHTSLEAECSNFELDLATESKSTIIEMLKNSKIIEQFIAFDVETTYAKQKDAEDTTTPSYTSNIKFMPDMLLLKDSEKLMVAVEYTEVRDEKTKTYSGYIVIVQANVEDTAIFLVVAPDTASLYNTEYIAKSVIAAPANAGVENTNLDADYIPEVNPNDEKDPDSIRLPVGITTDFD